jgi:hypothetical protein
MVYYSTVLVVHFDCEMMLEFNFATGGRISYYLYKFQRCEYWDLCRHRIFFTAIKA